MFSTSDTSAITERMRIDSSGNVGIGTASPIDRLHIVGDDGGTGRTTHQANAQVIIENNGDAALVFSGCNTDVGVIQWDDVDAVSQGSIYYSHATDAMHFGTADGERMVIDCSGAVTKPTTPAFLARTKTGDYSQYTQSGTSEVHIMQYCNERFDQGGDFGGACKVFTAPVGGKYFLNVENGPNGIAGCVYALLVIYTSNATYVHSFNQCAAAVSGGYASVNLTVLADMDSGDIACTGILVAGGAKTIGVGGASDYFWFSGALIA